jgi:8-oxo-dGTP pyrophosphatase MutT (NUDIX family)
MADLPIVTAGLVVCRRGEYLLLRAYRNWDFPKGVVEPGESPRQAALREAREEVGLSETDLRLLSDEPYQTTPYRSQHAGKPCRKQALFFAAELQGEPALSLSREHHEAVWLAPGEAAKRLVPRLAAVLAWAMGLPAIEP